MTDKPGKKRVLCVGLVCLDCITVCDGFPEEDSDQRCVDILWQRGGNASNSSTSLALVGEACEFMGVMTDSIEQRILEEDLRRYGIVYEHCVVYPGIRTPVATILSNAANGSRTILSCQRRLPELSLDDFQKLPLHEGLYKWIHFEGRPGAGVIRSMLEYVDALNAERSTERSGVHQRIVTSVEIEKRRDDLSCLFDAADVVFVSKDYAQALDYHCMEDAARHLHRRCRQGSILICPWGDRGAAAVSRDGTIVTSPAYPPPLLVDTLAAGDTFIGAAIAALSNDRSLKEALAFACRVAGAKCGLRGWNGMADKIKEIMN